MPVSSPAPALTAVRAHDAMNAPIAAVDPSMPLADVAALMSRKRHHCVVVDGITREAGGEHLVWGIVSDLDLLRGALTGGAEADAGTAAASPAICVDPQDNLEQVAAELIAYGASHAIVVEADIPVGVISTLDLARVLGEGSTR